MGENVMNNMEGYTQALFGLVVSTFLLNTGRALTAIELCKESVVLLIICKEEHFVKSSKIIYRLIYIIMFNAYLCICDNTNAIAYGRKLLVIYRECDEKVNEGKHSLQLARICFSQSKYVDAKELYERVITIMRETGDKRREGVVYGSLGWMYRSLGKYVKARKYLEKALTIREEIGDRDGEAADYAGLGAVLHFLGEYVKAKEYLKKALAISKEIGNRNIEAIVYGSLGNVFQRLGEYLKAKEYLEKALEITMEIDDRVSRAEVGTIYGNLGCVFLCLGEYFGAKKYFEKALAIRMETGDKAGEAADYENMGTFSRYRGEYVKAKGYYEKALQIRMEIGDRAGEAEDFCNLGSVFRSLGDYVKAKEYHQKALAITMEIGNRAGKMSVYGALGTVFQSIGEHVSAKEYHEKALAIAMEIGDKAGEAKGYGELGNVFQSVGEYVKAKDHLEKALAIRMETGDRTGEARVYGNLGIVFKCIGEYVKAREYLEKSLSLKMQLGDREGVAADYGNLGTLFQSLGEYVKAKEYDEKALAIATEIGDKEKEATLKENLAVVFQSLRDYRKAKEAHDEALAIYIKIGNKTGQASTYGNLGALFEALGDNVKAEEYYEKALAIAIKIADRQQEALNYGRLGNTFRLLGEYFTAEDHLKKALSISKEIRDGKTEFQSYCDLTLIKLAQEKFHEALSLMFQSIDKCEHWRGSLGNNDQIKISFADCHLFPYQGLSKMFCDFGRPKDALCVAELGRARGLADLMATQYSAENHISASPQSWIGIENVTKKESNCTCLYISYCVRTVSLWILMTTGAVHFRQIRMDEKSLYTRLAKPAENLDEFFDIMVGSLRSFGILPEEVCEDRSSTGIETKPDSSQGGELTTLRRVKDKDDAQPSLALLFEMLIDPVSDLLQEPEIVIVPDRRLYRVPFPALIDEKGKYLSEKFRIRIVPSLTTLKLIQDSPADYHSQTGALIVGDPLNEKFVPLSCARKEAEMIGQLLGVQPLLGEHATKQAVLQSINSVSLIHFAAHGNAERGEIVLASLQTNARIPQEDDYLLKMSDISQVRLRARLVVLSCCHSGRGRIRAEGVVGIARAFLGAGARSVLVALWALEDSATEQLMSRFYEHLVRGESTSESLHEAMKWMRCNGYSDVKQWAPFMLIGDNVTFVF